MVKNNRLFTVLLIAGMVFYLSAAYAKAENAKPENAGDNQEKVTDNQVNDSNSQEDVNDNQAEDSNNQENVNDNQAEDVSGQDSAGNSQGEVNQTQNKEQEQAQTQNEDQNKTGAAVAEQRRSVVANAVQTMLQVAEKNSGIGQEVKVIAQTQTENQDKIESSLEKIQSRSGFAKFFIGPNYKEIKNAETLLEQNREQIKQLNEIKNQLTNQGDEQTLTEQIQVLEQANLEIENSLTKEKSGFSLFGWLFN